MEGAQKELRVTVKKLNMSQLGNCIFCLKKLVTSSKATGFSQLIIGDESEDLVEVPQALAFSSQFLNTLNGIWPYLENNNGSSGDGETHHLLETVLEGNPPPSNSSTLPKIKFSTPPKMCTFCESKVNAVEDLITSLKLKVEELRAIISKSKKAGECPWRGEHLESNCATGPLDNKDVATSTIHSFDALGGYPDDEQIEEESENNGEQLVARLQSEGSKLVIGEGGESGQVEWKEEDENSDDDPEKADWDPDYIKSEVDDDESLMSLDDLCPVFSEGESNEDWDPLEDNQPHTSVISQSKPKKRKLTRTKRVDSRQNVKGQCILLPCTMRGCEDKFDSVDKLQSHLADTHKIGIFECACGQTFSFKKDGREHQKTCDVHLKKRESLRPSKIQLKAKPQICVCDLCGMKVGASKFGEHLEGHIGDYILKCPNISCSKVFSCNHTLTPHTRRGPQICRDAFQKDPKLCTCETCGFKAFGRFRLNSHLQDLHERGSQKMFKCPLDFCDKTFSVRQSVPFHLDTHSKYSDDTASQKCEHCNKKIKMEEIEDHLKAKHDAVEIVKCGQCHYLFSSNVSLVEHQIVHRHTGMYCHICSDGIKYPRHDDLRKHYRTAHKVAGTEYICEHCNQTFWNKLTLCNHQLTKHSKDGKIKEKKKAFPCDSCQHVGFSSEAALIAHRIRVHGDLPFTCSLCPATFSFKPHLSRHEKEHAGIHIQQQEFTCQHLACGKKFKSQANFKSHVKHHLRDCVCDLCGKRYGHRTRLKAHHDSVHLNLRPFVCENCGEGFSTAAILKSHILIHTGERPYACKICDQKFRHKSVLRNHLKGHEKKGTDFKPNGPMKQIRKRRVQ